MDKLNASGALYLTHVRLDDKLTMRMSADQTGSRGAPRPAGLGTDQASGE